ncbi:MAG TPA: erythromycin esterase family protein [Thermoanaerobaculia bacterium]|nr:erythromycin esterase family protein [Thermoanaerobaculia bacterium]
MMKLPWTRRRLSATFALVALLMAASFAGAQPFAPGFEVEAAKPAPPVGYPVVPGIWRLHGHDPMLPYEDLEPLRQIIGRASVVALGESFHTSGGFYLMKHRVFRFLVEQMGFRAFAIESNWTMVEPAARYVQTCEGSPDEAVSGHWGVFQSTELSDLARWMCEWNRDHPNPADKLQFFGFDVQQPEDDGPALVAFLQRIGIAADHPWMEGIRACDGVTTLHPLGTVPPETHEICLQTLAAIDLHFRRNGKGIARQTSQYDLAVAKLQLVSLKAWENQAFIFPHDYPTGISVRDEGMAYAFLTQRALRAPRARTVIWAANMHVSRAVLPNGARPMGSFLAAALRRDYVSFALGAYETEIDFPGLPCGAVERRENTVEERLHELGEDALLVDLAFPGTRDPYLPRGFYNMGIDLLEPHREFNGIFYLEHSPKMHPLRWNPCR